MFKENPRRREKAKIRISLSLRAITLNLFLINVTTVISRDI